MDLIFTAVLAGAAGRSLWSVFDRNIGQNYYWPPWELAFERPAVYHELFGFRSFFVVLRQSARFSKIDYPQSSRCSYLIYESFLLNTYVKKTFCFQRG